MKSALVALLIFLCHCGVPLFAQTSNCNLYEAVLGELVAHVNRPFEVTIVPPGGIDPLNPLPEVTEMSYGKRSLDFYIMPYVVDFSVKYVKWFAKEIEDSSLLNLDYNVSTDTTVNCVFNDTIRYRYSNDEEARFNETHFFLEGEGDSAVNFSPAKVAFSNILYYKDELALVCIRNKIAMQAGRDAAWLFVFEKRNGLWVVRKKVWLQG